MTELTGDWLILGRAENFWVLQRTSSSWEELRMHFPGSSSLSWNPTQSGENYLIQVALISAVFRWSSKLKQAGTTRWHKGQNFSLQSPPPSFSFVTCFKKKKSEKSKGGKWERECVCERERLTFCCCCRCLLLPLPPCARAGVPAPPAQVLLPCPQWQQGWPESSNTAGATALHLLRGDSKGLLDTT